MNTLRSEDSTISEFRKRQLRKDELLRRRIELELSRKRNSATRVPRKTKAIPGTVMFLKPSEPIMCKRGTSAYEAARLMSARRGNCVLVVDNEGHLEGIFTAKDLAFRIVGSSLSANLVTIDQIMTAAPLCTHTTSPSSEALNLMVEMGFRHLPVLDDDGQVVGVLDITKAYEQQMEKLERLHQSSNKLYEALDSVHSEMDLCDQPRQVYEYFNSLKLRIEGPILESVLDDTTVPIFASNRTSVYEATLLMKKHNTTAVLVRDLNEGVTGIFTSKDVVLRVIAAGMDPKNCSLVRVMTPKPDVADINTTIQTALRRMFDGHFLNLPIVEDGRIVAIVDVLKLTYATLNQIKRIQPDPRIDASPAEVLGPAWNSFWMSLDNEESGSVLSGSGNDLRGSDLTPGDSISLVNDRQLSSPLTPPSVHEGDFIFKFRSPVVSERVHRVVLKQDGSLENLQRLIHSKLDQHELSELFGDSEPTPGLYKISYSDDEGDLVSLTTDGDLLDCIYLKRALNLNRAELVLHPVCSVSTRASTETKKPSSPISTELVIGIPNALILSGIFGFLTIAAAAMYTRNRP